MSVDDPRFLQLDVERQLDICSRKLECAMREEMKANKLINDKDGADKCKLCMDGNFKFLLDEHQPWKAVTWDTVPKKYKINIHENRKVGHICWVLIKDFSKTGLISKIEMQKGQETKDAFVLT